MAGSTISSHVTINVTLGSGLYLSPLTVASAGYIDPIASRDGAGGLVATIAGGSVLNQGTVLGGGGGGSFTHPSLSGGAGGVGVDLANGRLTNDGRIVGGSGTYGYRYYVSVGAGGSGVMALDSSLSNYGTILGGNSGIPPGNAEGSSGSPGSGVMLTNSSLFNQGMITGGSAPPSNGNVYDVTGGTGVDATGSSTAVNAGEIGGGAGGYSRVESAGAGGAGVSLAAGATLINSGGIDGGAGGNGYIGGNSQEGATGGDGVDATIGVVVNSSFIVGGFGGYAGGPFVYSGGGFGGTGANLIGGSLINSGGISGGTGGRSAHGDGGIGGTGVSLSGGATLTNFGRIAGGAGNDFFGPNSSFEAAGGTGLSIVNSSATNDGTISDGGAYGLGVYLRNSTLTNAGTIFGGVRISGTAASRLIVDPDAVFVGSVAGEGVATLELASAAGVGAITGIGSSFSGFGAVTVDASATWVAFGSVTGAGTVGIGAGADMVFEDTVAATTPVDFVTNTGSLGIGDTAGFAATVFGFQVGDAFDFTSISSAGSITAGVNASNELTLTSGGSLLAEIQLDPTQNLTDDVFHAASDGGSGTLVTAEPLCFLAGTMIATPDGETPVERLAVGGMVVTASGAILPIVWIGTGRVLATRNRRGVATPVIVRKGALGDNVPHTDLRVTKAHALWLDGVLIPVEFVVNHRTILWDDMAQEVMLYHVELEAHDVLLANGAPAESYRDDGNRWLFQNGNSGWDLPAQVPHAPVLTGGPVVDEAWLRLLGRAGVRPGLPLTDDPDLHLVVDGRRLDAVSRAGGFYVFQLADTPEVVRVACRSGAPQELGLARDPRCLGVAMRRIVIRQGRRSRVIEADDERLLEGFHAFESDNRFRWTDGYAALPAPLFAGFAGSLEVVLDCAATTRYVEEGGTIRRKSGSASGDVAITR
jgi:hypothetical protein